MSKKTVLMLLFAAVVLLGVAIWIWGNVLYKPAVDAQPKQTDSGRQAAGQMEKQPLLYISSRAVTAPALAHDEKSIWYFEKESSRLYKQALGDQKERKEFPLPDHDPFRFVLWPSVGADFIAGTDTALLLYDARATKMVSYPEEVKFVEWLPLGQRVAYVWSTADRHELYTALPALTDRKLIASLPHADFRISVAPNGKAFMLYSASGQHPVFMIIEGIGVLEQVLPATAVSQGVFSPDGQRFAYIKTAGGQSGLNIYDLTTRTNVLDGDLAAAGDLAWSHDNEGFYYSSDDGYLKFFSLADQTAAPILKPQPQRTPAEELFLNNNETVIYFVEKNTGKLGRILLE